MPHVIRTHTSFPSVFGIKLHGARVAPVVFQNYAEAHAVARSLQMHRRATGRWPCIDAEHDINAFSNVRFVRFSRSFHLTEVFIDTLDKEQIELFRMWCVRNNLDTLMCTSLSRGASGGFSCIGNVLVTPGPSEDVMIAQLESSFQKPLNE